MALKSIAVRRPIATHDGTGDHDSILRGRRTAGRQNRLTTPLEYRRSSRLPGRLVLDVTGCTANVDWRLLSPAIGAADAVGWTLRQRPRPAAVNGIYVEATAAEVVVSVSWWPPSPSHFCWPDAVGDAIDNVTGVGRPAD
jgi:hypothetical protein